MPELPEVESVRRSLQSVLGHTVCRVQLLFTGVVMGDPEQFTARLQGQHFVGIERYGKYLAFRFQSGGFMMMHLRMTGQAILVQQNEAVDRHCRARFLLDRGLELRYSDMRKFGRVAYVADRAQLMQLFTLGPEPLTNEFTVEALAKAIRGKRAVKGILLDQSRVAGLGNIYADEALFRAGIHPERLGDAVGPTEIARLHGSINACIRDALAHGGTTIRNYVQGDGRPGEYKDHLRVYGRYGEPCLDCGTTLQRIRVGGRGTVFCQQCQE